MRLAAVAITDHGLKLCSQLNQELEGLDVYITEKLAANLEKNPAETETVGFKVLDASLKEEMKNLLAVYEGLICFMALGIVIRVISPWLQNKRVDPAVVTIDESGSYVISTLSGHLGGANKLTERVANILEAQPVITTATDVSNKPSLDLLAAELNCALVPFARVKGANAALVNENKLNIFCKNAEYKQALLKAVAGKNIAGNFSGENIEFISSAEKTAELTEGTAEEIRLNQLQKKKGFSLIFTNHKISYLDLLAEQSKDILQMIPRNIIIGIGARRNIKAEKVEQAINRVQQELDLRKESLKALATVDLKQEEPGLNRAAEEMDLPLEIVTKEEISREMESANCKYSFSNFVKDKIGVGGVCEPAAMLTARKGKMLQEKKSHEGVTTAVVEESFILWE